MNKAEFIASKLKTLAENLSDVKPKTKIPEGLFTRKASGIVRGLLDLTNGDKGKAMKKLNFYINRFGEDLPNKTEVMKAKKMLETNSYVDVVESNLILWGRKKGENREDEVIVYTGTENTNLDLLNRVKQLAKKDGYKVFRIQNLNTEDKDLAPDFKRIRQKARKRKTEKVLSSFSNYPKLREVLENFSITESNPENERKAARTLLDCLD